MLDLLVILIKGNRIVLKTYLHKYKCSKIKIFNMNCRQFLTKYNKNVSKFNKTYS